jgi:hypothetical protein
MSNVLSKAASGLTAWLRHQSPSESAGLFSELSARELREYGLRCCALGSIQDRRIYDLHLLGF